MIAIIGGAFKERWDRTEKRAKKLLDYVCGGGICSAGTMNCWLSEVKKLPNGCQIWIVNQVRRRISDSAGEELWLRLSRGR